MIRQADLHMHSTASDGQYTPAQLVQRVCDAGIAVMALTDHDTIDGVGQAAEAGAACGITVLRGVELGAKENRYLHILGLGLQGDSAPIEALCRRMREGRDERKHRIVQFLAEKGVPVCLEEVEAVAGGAVIARPHFAQVLLRHGYVSSIREAFDRYLDTDEYQRIERFKADAPTCIQAVHRSGGKAVLAHPYQLGMTEDGLEQLVRTLKEAGLDGIECHYPRHTPEMTGQYLTLAARYGLHVSGGSDFHGEAVRPDTILRPLALELDWLLC